MPKTLIGTTKWHKRTIISKHGIFFKTRGYMPPKKSHIHVNIINIYQFGKNLNKEERWITIVVQVIECWWVMWGAFDWLLHFFIDNSVSTLNVSLAGSMFQLMWKIHKVKSVVPKHIEELISLLFFVGGKQNFLPIPRKSWDKAVRRGLAWLKIFAWL